MTVFGLNSVCSYLQGTLDFRLPRLKITSVLDSFCPHPKSLSLRERDLKKVTFPFSLREKGQGMRAIRNSG
jgi:hypothetical protein